MKSTSLRLALAAGLVVMLISCNKKNEVPEPSGNNSPKLETRLINKEHNVSELNVPAEELLDFTLAHHNEKGCGALSKATTSTKFNQATHDSYVYTCAKKLGISEARAVKMGMAAQMPDYLQSGLEHGFNQIWSHSYMILESGKHMWGGADEHCFGNLMGPEAPGKESIGYENKWAGYYYDQGDQKMGDWYIGYGLHFITDVCEVMHSTFYMPKVSMTIHHFDFENWVEANWTEGFNFSQVVQNTDPSEYYTVSGVGNVKEAVQQAALHSNYYNSDFSKKAWDAYSDCDYPTGVGEGNEQLVANVKIMIKEATKRTGGMLKFCMDHYNQWN